MKNLSKECVIISPDNPVKDIFKKYREKDIGIKGFSLTSKNGITVATAIYEGDKEESFSTLSATILGASEVIFSTFQDEEPDTIVADSVNLTLFITGMDKRVLAVMGEREGKEEIMDALDEMVEEIKAVSEKTEMSKGG